MKRKLVKQAGSAFTVTLPINWVRERGLKAGDEIDVVQREKNILISTDNFLILSSKSLSIKGLSYSEQFAYIAAAYACGIDELNLEIDDNVVPKLDAYLGYVVVNQTKNNVMIQDITSGLNDNVDLIFKRTFQFILRYFDLAMNDIFNDQRYTILQVRDLDIELNKLSFFLQRIVMKKTMDSDILGKLLFTYSYVLEKIGDNILRMWRLIVESKNKFIFSDSLKDLFKIVSISLEKSFSLYYRFNNEIILDLKKLKNEYRAKAFPLFDNSKEKALLLMYLTNIFDDSYDLKHLALMKEFSS